MLEYRVGDRLAHEDTGNLGHDVVQAVEVLHIERRENVDPCREKVFHVLPALDVSRSGSIRVRELVDENETRAAFERGVEIEFLDVDSSMLDFAPRQKLQANEERPRVVATMGLHDAHDYVAFLVHELDASGLEHRVRLADSRRCAEEDRQLAASCGSLLLAYAGEKLVGIRPALGGGRHRQVSANRRM